MQVPFVDLKKQYQNIKAEIEPVIQEVVENGMFILGPKVQEFETNFAAYCGKKDAVGVNSGTSALHLALTAAGVGKGDEVITTPNTFIATLEAISHCNAVPKLVDIDKEDYLMDVSKLEQAITEKTKAIIPVHLYGQTVDMKPVQEIAEKHNLIVIEDAAQAHGAEYNGIKAPVGDLGCFSFYPAKNLGAFGEGGAVVGNNEEIIEKVRLLRAHGEKPKNTHSSIGYNYRMDGIQGAALSIKLRYLDEWNSQRREAAKLYSQILDGTVQVPVEREGRKHVYHLYVIQTENRDNLLEALGKEGIGCGIHYPVPVHLQPAYSFLGYGKGSFIVSEKVQDRILTLPIFPEIEKEQIEYVGQKVKGNIAD